MPSPDSDPLAPRSNTIEDRFRTIADAAADGIVMIDPAGTITFWNLAASRVFGYTAAEACGRHLHDLVVPATMIDEHRHAFREFMQTGLGRAVGQTVEMQAVRSDRTEVPVEVSVTGVWRTIDSACLVERDEHGTPIRVIGVNREAGR